VWGPVRGPWGSSRIRDFRLRGLTFVRVTIVPAVPSPPVRLRGVRQNNLRGIDVDLPYDRLTVVTGVSGSGKSSLVFDTLYAEGRRRYVETFSAYARQFLERMPRPAVDRIDDLPPAVAVEQANPVRTSRSTVGTMTELTDHLKLLFEKAATLHCGTCGGPVVVEDATHLTDAVEALPHGMRVTLTFPLPPAGGLPWSDQAKGLRAAGFSRVVDGAGQVRDIAESGGTDPGTNSPLSPGVDVVADRFVAGQVERSRVLSSAEQALRLGRDRAALVLGDGRTLRFSRALHCARCDVAYRRPQANLFSFNSPLGACPTCRGFGRTIEMDVDAMIPDQDKTLAKGAIRPWTTKATRPERKALERFCARRMIRMDVPWRQLAAAHRKAIVEGTTPYAAGSWVEEDDSFYGLAGWMKWLETKTYKMHVRVLLSRYRKYTLCGECKGTRRRPESLLWRLGGRNVHEWEVEPIDRTLAALRGLSLSPQVEQTVKVVRDAIDARLSYLVEVGLGYLTLDRQTKTLSGGEFQRVNLATALGAALVNTLYVLDEPSVGLHARDTERLLAILHKLRDRGNTLVVVEHDPDTIAAADHVVDLGPGAGEHGGRVLFQGPLAELSASQESVTARFLRGEDRVRSDRPRRPSRGFLVAAGCTGHNLKDVDLRIPVGCLTAVCGVSGGGKSSLVVETLFPAMERRFGRPADEPLPHRELNAVERFREVRLVDQSAIGRTPRSNPATYTGAMKFIRELFGRTPDARRLRLTPKSFSFNSRGGRCPVCEGAGQELLEMQFLADVYVPCSECEGRRFKPEVLEAKYKGRDVNDVLSMTVDEAIAFFHTDAPLETRLRATLDPLRAVGLGYLRLGQSATTLSGGEAQRLKLAGHLGAGGRKTLFLFDEPTTGLHLADVKTLLTCLHRLVDEGHTVVVVEHHLSVIASADHVIEVGPEGGDAGGRIVAVGTPEEVAHAATPTAPFLARELAG
jgi:excinuclease ABC subunit A